MPTSCKKIYKREGDQSNTPRAKQGYCLASVYLTSSKAQINVCFFVINFGYTVPAVTRRDFIKHQAAIALRIKKQPKRSKKKMKLIVLAITLCLMAITTPSEGKIFDRESHFVVL